MSEPVICNITVGNHQLAEIRFTDLGAGDWSAQVAVGTDSEVLLYQRGIPAYPEDLNVLGLLLLVLSRLPEEAFSGQVKSHEIGRFISPISEERR